jgi:hypothetical protein
MRTSRLFAVAALFTSFAWVLAGGCSSADTGGDSGAPNNNTGGTVGGTQGNPAIVTPDAASLDGGPLDGLNALCGVGPGTGACLPDDSASCAGYMPPESNVGGAGGESSAGGAGAGGAGGAGGEAGTSSPGGAPGAGGEGGSAGGVGGAGGEAGNASEPGVLAAYSCQVTRQSNMLVRQCLPAGRGKVNAPCFSSGDCAPGSACVMEGDAGRCLPYCCDQSSNCIPGTFCAERPLRKAASDTSTAEPPHVPVCVPADACSLEEQFPCPSGTECRCKGDTACMVVRDDGTTTCMKPGTGLQGDACPCAWNHVCSSVTQQCVKICRTDPTKDDCGVQKCQASSELPPNFGVCVGPVK